MRRVLMFLTAVAIVAACGGADPVGPARKPKPDPYVTVRVRNSLDTTTAPGRAMWHLYVLLSGPQSSQNGVGYQGNFILSDARRGTPTRCMAIGADSIGQRLIAPFAIADTTTEALFPASRYDSIANRWYSGNHAAPPAGMMIFTMDPIDAWDSEQYAAGHGLVREDPIKWRWDWMTPSLTAFAERAATDTAGCNAF